MTTTVLIWLCVALAIIAAVAVLEAVVFHADNDHQRDTVLAQRTEIVRLRRELAARDGGRDRDQFVDRSGTTA